MVRNHVRFKSKTLHIKGVPSTFAQRVENNQGQPYAAHLSAYEKAKRLLATSLAFLLPSADEYNSSDYCYDARLTLLLARASSTSTPTAKATATPVLIRCLLQAPRDFDFGFDFDFAFDVPQTRALAHARA
jgi:hypothetical protein